MIKPQFTISQESVGLSAQQPVKASLTRVSRASVPPHDHEFYELVLVVAGGATHLTNSRPKPIRQGDFLILSPGQAHGFEDAQGMEVYNVYYLAESLLASHSRNSETARLCMLFGGRYLFPSKAPQDPIHLSLGGSIAAAVRTEFSQLEEKSESKSPFLLRCTALKSFALIDQSLSQTHEYHFAFLQHHVVRHVFRCIERSLTEGTPCQVASWAAATSLSPDHLSKVFRKCTGESPSTCFQRRRLQRAADALIHSPENLSQIAYRLGFSDSPHFARQFRSTYGMSPKRYRNRFAS